MLVGESEAARELELKGADFESQEYLIRVFRQADDTGSSPVSLVIPIEGKAFCFLRITTLGRIGEGNWSTAAQADTLVKDCLRVGFLRSSHQSVPPKDP